MVSKNNSLNVTSTTAGQVLQSGGTASPPSYSTATYPTTAGTSGKILISDGTNIVSSTPTYPNASATSGKIIISDGTNFIASTATHPNTTTTGDVIYASASNVYSNLAIGATAGQFLASNGLNPFWFSNTQNILMRDDFFSNYAVSDIGFTGNGGGSGGILNPDTTNSSNIHPGVWSIYSSSAFANRSMNTGIVFYFGGGAIIADFVAKIPILSNVTNRVDFYIGFTDGSSPPGTTANIYFHYRDNLNSGNWVLITSSSGSTTTVNTSTAVDTNWHKYTITINSDATLVTFYIDNVSVGTSSTNISTSSGSGASFQSVNNGASDGTQMLLCADLFSYYQALTTAR